MRTVGLLSGITLTFMLVASCTLSGEVDRGAGGTSGAAVASAGTQSETAGVGGLTGAGGLAGVGGLASSGGAGGMQPETSGGGGAAGEGGEGGMPTEGDPVQPNGVDCSSDAECASGFCVDKVCCDTKCGAACSSCRGENTGMADGVCGFVTSGTDANDDCAESNDACGRDGSCDGAGACRFKGVDHACGTESCSSGQYTPAAYCDGTGSCSQRTPISCGNYPCSGTVCAVTCTPSIQCPTGLWCDSGSCKAKKPTGTTCNGAAECVSAACIDGVCCDSDCTGTCRSCRAASTGAAEGHCAPITAGTDPNNECTAAAVSTCKNDGSCDGSGACRQYASGTVCQAKACSDGANSSSATAEVKCGGGSCGTATTSGCGDYTCNGDSCRSSCSQSAHCIKGKYCEGTACATTKAVGSLCKAPAECTTAICNNYETNVRPGHCCATPTNCACPGPAFANLLKNPGFDKDLSSWDIHDNGVPGGTYSWYQFEERDMCPHSGQFRRNPNSSTSGYTVSIRQCVPVQAGTSYNFGGSWKSSKLPEPAPGGEAWNASCMMAFYATLDLCKDYDNEYQSRFDGWKTADFHFQTSETYRWYDFRETIKAPNSAQAAVLDCTGTDDYAANTTIYFDKLYVSPAPTQY